MENLRQIIEKIESYVNEVEAAREKVLEESRGIIANCRRGIQLIHRNSIEEAEELIEEGYRRLREIYEVASRYAEMTRHSLIESAAREVVEAKCVLNFVRKTDLPDPEKMGVSFSSYIFGLCDAVGELRRLSLEAIKDDKVEEASHYLSIMEEVYDSIMRFSNPSSFLPIKKRQDSIRVLIEKTRSELAIATCERRIRSKVEEFRELLNNVGKGSRRKEDLDLDIDKVW